MGKYTGPTRSQLERWGRIRELGCAVKDDWHFGEIEIHHCKTGAGGRKNHDKVISLCTGHHRGTRGIHTLSRKVWQSKYDTEDSFLELTKHDLGEENEI